MELTSTGAGEVGTSHAARADGTIRTLYRGGMAPTTYTTTIGSLPRGRARVPFPFDPDELWGTKKEHHITGSIAGMGVRGTVEADNDGWAFTLGPAWLRDCPVSPGEAVEVVVAPEGPQRGDLAPDFAAALDGDSAAGEFFDGLAQFYRNAYIRWIDATKRRPEVRAQRISEVLQLLSEGIKERPKPSPQP